MPIQYHPSVNDLGLFFSHNAKEGNFFSPPVEKVVGSTVTETLSELLWPAVSITVSWKVYVPSCKWDSFRVPGWGTWNPQRKHHIRLGDLRYGVQHHPDLGISVIPGAVPWPTSPLLAQGWGTLKHTLFWQVGPTSNSEFPVLPGLTISLTDNPSLVLGSHCSKPAPPLHSAPKLHTQYLVPSFSAGDLIYPKKKIKTIITVLPVAPPLTLSWDCTCICSHHHLLSPSHKMSCPSCTLSSKSLTPFLFDLQNTGLSINFSLKWLCYYYAQVSLALKNKQNNSK